MSIASAHRPAQWTLASPDLNVLLTGHFVDDGELAHKTGHDSRRFQLAHGGLYIEHPTLVSVTCSPTSQTLASLNTGKPILTLDVDLLPDTPAQVDDHGSKSPAQSPSTGKGTIVTLHGSLLTPEQAHQKSNLPTFSSAFKILLDGPGFLPPRFDPTTLAPPTPSAAGQASVLNSPTIQRALLSPLLSPQRRAHSQGSDASVPPLNIGVSRARAPSLSGGSASTSAAHQQAGSVARGRESGTNGRSPSRSRPPPDDLTRVVEPAGRLSLDQVMTSEVSTRAKSTAEEIMTLRRQHDAFVKRLKAELDVLTTRVTNAANAVSTTLAPGSGLVVKGFRASSSKSRSPSDRKEDAREPSVGRGGSEERGRGRATRGTSANDLDEQRSQEIREEDERQEEERGRSRSRIRRGPDGEPERKSNYSTSKSRDKVAEVVAAATAASATSAPSTIAAASAPVAGDSIPAVLDDSADDQASTSAPAGPSAIHAGRESVTTPMFVPSSHALVSIPETEELSLPPSEAGGDRTPDPRASPRPAQASVEDDEDEEEHDAPFEMDEDIDVDDLSLDEPTSSAAGEIDEQAPIDDPPAARTTASGQSGSTFKPGSLRTSNLSSSYAALLSSSVARQPSPLVSSYRPPSMASFKAASAFHRRHELSTVASSLEESPRDAPHPTSTSAKEDASVELAYVPTPDPKLAREGESKIREVLAMDAPSHRAPLPSRRRRVSRQNSSNSADDDDVNLEDGADGHLKADAMSTAASRYAVGSLPISIGFARPTSSTFRPPPERELERKTSVPSREGMFVVPLLRDRARKQNVTGGGGGPPRSTGMSSSELPASIAIGPSSSPIRGRSVGANASASAATGSSSLAQSLRSYSGNARSFAQAVEEEDEEEDQARESMGLTAPSGRGRETNGRDAQPSPDGRSPEPSPGVDHDEEEDFVPPHELVKNQRRTDEEYLSRSVRSYE